MKVVANHKNINNANYHILDLSVMNDIIAIVEGRFDKKVSLDRI